MDSISRNGKAAVSCEYWVLWYVPILSWNCFWSWVFNHDPEAFFLFSTNDAIVTIFLLVNRELEEMF